MTGGVAMSVVNRMMALMSAVYTAHASSHKLLPLSSSACQPPPLRKSMLWYEEWWASQLSSAPHVLSRSRAVAAAVASYRTRAPRDTLPGIAA